MVANHFFRKIGIGRHHRRHNAVANYNVKKRHVIGGGNRDQNNHRGQHAIKPLSAQRQQTHQKERQQHNGHDLGDGSEPVRYRGLPEKTVKTTIENR